MRGGYAPCVTQISVRGDTGTVGSCYLSTENTLTSQVEVHQHLEARREEAMRRLRAGDAAESVGGVPGSCRLTSPCARPPPPSLSLVLPSRRVVHNLMVLCVAERVPNCGAVPSPIVVGARGGEGRRSVLWHACRS